MLQLIGRYVPGWKACFRPAQAPRVMRELDEWPRHRLRALQLKQWRRGTTIFRELRRLGTGADLVARIAGNALRWWCKSALGLNRVLPNAYFDRLGVPRLSDLNFSNVRCGPACWVVWEGADQR